MEDGPVGEFEDGLEPLGGDPDSDGDDDAADSRIVFVGDNVEPFCPLVPEGLCASQVP